MIAVINQKGGVVWACRIMPGWLMISFKEDSHRD